MQCPDQLRDVLLDIIGNGLLRIRHFADARDWQSCFVEADHLHNLPYLIKEYHRDLLQFYWHTEREVFIQQCAQGNLGEFPSLWDRLLPFID
ncbi:MAG TPA: hypothetical protein VF278_08975 [Pirellulales bacterium]